MEKVICKIESQSHSCKKGEIYDLVPVEECQYLCNGDFTGIVTVGHKIDGNLFKYDLWKIFFEKT